MMDSYLGCSLVAGSCVQSWVRATFAFSSILKFCVKIQNRGPEQEIPAVTCVRLIAQKHRSDENDKGFAAHKTTINLFFTTEGYVK